MARGIREFMRRIAEDEELRTRVAESGSLEEAYAASGAEAAGFTLEEFTEFIAEAVPAGDELSVDDLAQVAGGFDHDVFDDVLKPKYLPTIDDCHRYLPPDLRPVIDPSMFQFITTSMKSWSNID